MTPRREPRTRPNLEWLEGRDMPADLAAVSFDLLTGPAGPGDRVRAQYTLVNADYLPSGAFDVQVRLSRAVTLTTFRDVPWNQPYYERLGFRAMTETSVAGTLPGLAEIMREEASRGLDPATRVAMVLLPAQERP